MSDRPDQRLPLTPPPPDACGAIPPKRINAPRREATDVILACARLLFVNGQTTEHTIAGATRLAEAFGYRVHLFAHWDGLTIRIEDDAGASFDMIAAEPLGVDMNKVAATMNLVDKVCDGRASAATTRPALEAITRLPPVSLSRFVLFAGAGAAALGVIFGADHLLSLVLIALSAGAGALLRRGLTLASRNPFVPPFCAALLAGVIGAIVVRLDLSSMLRLVAVCPCMVLVPGPHLLNGMIDLARARIALGGARIGFASLIILMICAGLLVGLALGGTGLPVSGASRPIPLGYDMIAAGVAVAAYGAFFSLPWRMLPIPILVGMLAHASRWAMLTVAGASAETGAFVACLIVGAIMTPLADRLRLPFAAVAFASVVSLIPGVFLFRMAGGFVDLMTLGAAAAPNVLPAALTDGATAFLIIVAMGFGLIIPKLCIQHFVAAFAKSKSGRLNGDRA